MKLTPGVDFTNIFTRSFWACRCQFHQRFMYKFFVQIFWQSQNVTRKTKFVQKICAFNVDEIDGRSHKRKKTANLTVFFMLLDSTQNVDELDTWKANCFDEFDYDSYHFSSTNITNCENRKKHFQGIKMAFFEMYLNKGNILSHTWSTTYWHFTKKFIR